MYNIFKRAQEYFSIPDAKVSKSAIDWKIWEKTNKFKYPFKWFLIRTIPEYFFLIKKKYMDEPYWWLRYRFIESYNKINIQSLSPDWHDKNEIMLHANFQLLVDFVEIELAHMNIDYFKKNKLKYLKRRERHAKSGIDFLQWEIDDNDCKIGQYPTQSDIAKIKLDLYIWWTTERPNRKEPWSDYQIWNKVKDIDLNDILSPNVDFSRAGNIAQELDQLYESEDQHQLERLIKIRSYLWS